MKVSKAIELLQELNLDEEIAISWWEANLFTIGDNNETLSADSQEWLRAVEVFDANGGYDGVNQQVWEYLNYDITGQGDF